MEIRTWGSLHSHRENKESSFTESLRLHLDLALVLSHDSFADRKSESEALPVHALILLFKLARASEEISKVASFNASTSVADVNDEEFRFFAVGHSHLDQASLCECESVLY